MIALSQVIERCGADYWAQFNPLPSQLQALAALGRCRTKLAATFTAQCSNDACAALRVLPHSCGIATARTASTPTASAGSSGASSS